MISSNNLSILKFSRFGLSILILFLFAYYFSQTYLFHKIEKLEEKKQILDDSYTSLHEFIYQTELLLTSYKVQDKKENFQNSYVAYKSDLDKFSKSFFISSDTQNYREIIDTQIKDIITILKKESFNNKNQMYKPLLVRLGELNRTEDKSSYFILVKSFFAKTEHLKQYQNFLLEDMYQKKETISLQYKKDIQFTNFLFTTLPLVIIIFALIISFIIDRLAKEKEHALINTKDLLLNIINSIPLRVFWKDNNGTYLGANHLFLGDTKLPSIDQLVGKNDFELAWKNKEAYKYTQDDKSIISSKQGKLNIIETQTSNDGILRHLNTSKVPLFNKDDEVDGILGIYEDITIKLETEKKLKQQEIQLLQQNRLAQMGEMIAMIAHQWRQPLNTINITTGSIMLKMNKNIIEKEVILDKCNMIVDQVQFLSTTIEDFRNFFKPDKAKQKTSSKLLIKDTIHIIQPILEQQKIKVSVEIHCEKEIETYTNEVKQVLLNVIKNAQDAFLENHIENPTIHIKTFCSAKSKCRIIIEDNAGGIPENIIENIFDPYFSTKDHKNGTGLGLYMSKLIIEEHCEGSIKVESSNQNTKFTLRI